MVKKTLEATLDGSSAIVRVELPQPQTSTKAQSDHAALQIADQVTRNISPSAPIHIFRSSLPYRSWDKMKFY